MGNWLAGDAITTDTPFAWQWRRRSRPEVVNGALMQSAGWRLTMGAARATSRDQHLVMNDGRAGDEKKIRGQVSRTAGVVANESRELSPTELMLHV